MDSKNPYTPPSTRWLAPVKRSEEAAAICGFLLAMTVPALYVWDWVAVRGYLPRVVTGNITFGVVFSIVVIVLNLMAVPLSILGLRSRRSRLAYIGAVSGLFFAGFVYYRKFHPWLVKILAIASFPPGS